MCLNYLIPNEERDKIINKIGTNGKRVFKVVRVVDGKYYPLFKHCLIPFKEGEMDAERSESAMMDWQAGFQKYKVGFHFWLHKKDAEKVVEKIRHSQRTSRAGLLEQFKNVEVRVITCTVKKSWITKIGIDRTSNHKGIAVVAKKAKFPKVRK